jgi:hypothetical protein
MQYLCYFKNIFFQVIYLGKTSQENKNLQAKYYNIGQVNEAVPKLQFLEQAQLTDFTGTPPRL